MSQSKPDDLIKIPANFPVHWENPDDERLFWAQDQTHCPDPMTPLDFSFMQITDDGINKAAKAYDIPIRVYDRHINTYLYIAIVPQGSSSDDEIAIKAQQSEEKLQEAMGNLGNLWQKEWLPHIQQHLAYWEAYDLRGASLPTLLEHLDETEKRFHHAWEIHFLLFIPMMLAISQFADLYLDLFSDAEPFDAYELLAGFENKTVESSQLLWKLSRQILASSTVRQVFAENSTSDVIAKLSESTEGQVFLTALNGYLELHGQRGDKLMLNTPFWIEEPAPVLKSLKDYIAQSDRDVLADMESITERREQRVAAARKRLQGYPQPVVQQFEFFLKAAQIGYMLKEEHNYWIDYKVSYQVRQVLLAMGERLAEAGVMDAQNDIFYLNLDELKEIATNRVDRRSLINERKAIELQFATLTPPLVLGTPSSDPPADDPVSQMFLKMEGDIPPPSEVAGELRGNAGSPGVVRGIAKVVHTLAEATKLEPGDILVAEATAPSWSLLFASVSAVVTNSGGILSHCAVLAREYAIPAVVGTGMATTMIQDGQTIEVDGNTGIVRIITA